MYGLLRVDSHVARKPKVSVFLNMLLIAISGRSHRLYYTRKNAHRDHTHGPNKLVAVENLSLADAFSDKTDTEVRRHCAAIPKRR